MTSKRVNEEAAKRTKGEPSELGQRLKQVRESAGIDDEVLSVVAGLSRTHVHSIEVGWIKSPKYETALALSQALGALDYVLAGTGSAPDPQEVQKAFRRAKRARRARMQARA